MKMAKVRNDTKIHTVYFLRTKHGKCVQKRKKRVSPDIMREGTTEMWSYENITEITMAIYYQL